MKIGRVVLGVLVIYCLWLLVECSRPIGIDSPDKPKMERIVSIWLYADETLPHDLDLSGVNLHMHRCDTSGERGEPIPGEYVSSNFTNEHGSADFWHPEEAFFICLEEETLPENVRVDGESVLYCSFDMTQGAFHLTADPGVQR